MNEATRIVGTGSVIPEQVVPNDAFLSKDFLDENGQPYAHPNDVIIEKFQKITDIASRRYLKEDQVSSDIGAVAAQRAIEDAGWDPETIDLL
ncbi:MAG: ketoacyl-ACP synthase III, partial [Schleiferiaceae bacterium]|nr:ketoacyl-ACP synthase III [Schleiferiaceae bacterium]